MSELTTLTEEGPSWAAHRAELALKYNEQHSKGELSDSEFNELLEDLIRLNEINDRADNMVTSANLIRAVRALMIIV